MSQIIFNYLKSLNLKYLWVWVLGNEYIHSLRATIKFFFQGVQNGPGMAILATMGGRNSPEMGYFGHYQNIKSKVSY